MSYIRFAKTTMDKIGRSLAFSKNPELAHSSEQFRKTAFLKALKCCLNRRNESRASGAKTMRYSFSGGYGKWMRDTRQSTKF